MIKFHMNDIGFKNVLHNVGDISSDIGRSSIVRFYKGGHAIYRFNNIILFKVSYSLLFIYICIEKYRHTSEKSL